MPQSNIIKKQAVNSKQEHSESANSAKAVAFALSWKTRDYVFDDKLN